MSFMIALFGKNLHIFSGGKNLKIIRDLLLEDSCWDSADTISRKVLHAVLLELKPAARKTLLLKFSEDKDLRVRRSAIVSIVNMRGEIPHLRLAAAVSNARFLPFIVVVDNKILIHLIATRSTDPNDPRSSGNLVKNNSMFITCLDFKRTRFFGIATAKALINRK